MSKTAAIGVRMSPELKVALDKAAKDDMRSVAGYIEKWLTDHLVAKGYLDKPA